MVELKERNSSKSVNRGEVADCLLTFDKNKVFVSTEGNIIYCQSI